ncbi:putative lipoprotein [Pseudoalteromonas luteoviolacea B = ATCC 29581]|nr:putative lipoprotein [Pseudoalteromonas luteoviolacea B = ATCC 29581]
MNKGLILSTLLILLSGCGSSDTPTQIELPTEPQPPVVVNEGSAPPDNRTKQPYYILFFGNSHTGALPDLLTTLFNAMPELKAEIIKKAPGSGYLSDRLNDTASIAAINESPWTHIVLQAQKYSQSGGAVYPTDAAQTWISRSKNIAATPILFPEHPQKNNSTEGQMLQTLHEGIASKEPACIAPVGLVWDEALIQKPTIALHDDDGNHANQAGNFLTALVFFEVISGKAATSLPFIDSINLNNETQQWMKQVVSSVLGAKPACPF